MAFIAAKKGEVAEGGGWGEGVWWGPGWGPWKLIHGALGHTRTLGVGGGVGVAQAWQWGEGEERQWAPAGSFWRWWGGGGASPLQRMEGIS